MTVAILSKQPSEPCVARTLVSAASRLVSTLFPTGAEFSWLRSAMHRDESRCGSLKAAPRSDLLEISPPAEGLGFGLQEVV